MSWESEFETALVSAITADDSVTDLLVSATAVCRARPFQEAGYPQITFTWRDDSDAALASYGKIPLALQIDIWAAPDVADAIRAALHSLLDERTRIADGKPATAITLSSWDCKTFRYMRGHEIPTGLFLADAADTELIQRVTEWSVRLYKK